MNQKVQSESIRGFLIRHLVEIEDEKDTVLKEFYPRISVRGMEFQQFIGNYILCIEDYIKNIPTGNEPVQIPFVLIGSVVDIQDTRDGTIETVQIVSPFLNQGQVNYTFASYLSPMGRKLLLKGKGDKVKVELPAGCSHFIINDIRLS
jgi:Transcription elongation factor